MLAISDKTFRDTPQSEYIAWTSSIPISIPPTRWMPWSLQSLLLSSVFSQENIIPRPNFYRPNTCAFGPDVDDLACALTEGV